ncbi:amino acid deaminase [Diaminobutyricimonas sp. LJ205]|uniref:amino acid deaminase n=1 Tax=Diaminobutyricimonas sp. LJ205 TaxID=2683590 RepID=UPI001E2CE6DC|nr:amino acid deaminase [Diaminobutyricimonas sp. LJ205]
MNDELSASHKSIPSELWGTRAADAAAAAVPLSHFQTPVMVLDRSALDHNTRTMLDWVGAHGLEIAPHGKTTMAPALWKDLLDAGAVALTLATGWQVQAARSVGVHKIVLANELVDPVAAAWVAAELDADPSFEFCCWVDSPQSLAALGATTGHRPIDVLVELGGAHGRTGARDIPTALAVARAVAENPRLRLVGVSGYEGAFGGSRDAAASAAVAGYLAELVRLFETVSAAGLFAVELPVITAGGSAWFDLVAQAFAPLSGRVRLLIRSGAFQVHDHGHYQRVSPLGDAAPAASVASVAQESPHLRAAATVHSRVLSRPEPDLVILDAGRRDVAYDLDLPVVVDRSGALVANVEVTAVNDQHAFVRIPRDSTLAVGDILRLGISHPCTVFDKWRAIPVVADASAADPVVTEIVETYF